MSFADFYILESVTSFFFRVVDEVAAVVPSVAREVIQEHIRERWEKFCGFATTTRELQARFKDTTTRELMEVMDTFGFRADVAHVLLQLLKSNLSMVLYISF